jgi:hypothetical protein
LNYRRQAIAVQKKQKRQFLGQPEADVLVPFLNSGAEGKERLQKLVILNSELRELTEFVPRRRENRMLAALKVPKELRGRIASMPIPDMPKEGQAMRVQTVIQELNLILHEYAYAWELCLPWTHHHAWCVEWFSPRKTGEEARAFFKLVRLGEMDVLHQVKRCARPKCGRWFFATKPHAKYCNVRCQVRFYEKSEERKKRRAAWARTHYKLHVKNGGRTGR